MEYIRTEYINKLEEDLKGIRFKYDVDSYMSEYPLPKKEEALNFCKYLYTVFNDMKTTGEGLSKKDAYSKLIERMNEYVDVNFRGNEYREITKLLSQVIKLDLSISKKELAKTVKNVVSPSPSSKTKNNSVDSNKKTKKKNDYYSIIFEWIMKFVAIALYILLVYGISEIGNSITRAVLLLAALVFFPFFLIKVIEYNLK